MTGFKMNGTDIFIYMMQQVLHINPIAMRMIWKDL